MIKSLCFALSLFVAGFATPAIAQDVQNKALHFENGYAYATTSVQKNGAAFLTITNVSDAPAKIISASSDIAEKVELHTHIMEDDIMMMREVEAYDVPAGGTITLKPTGHHLMLMGLTRPLKAGESFPLTLVSENNGEMNVDITVKSPGAPE